MIPGVSNEIRDSPFVIFLIGGYLTIIGKLELGSLVTFVSAQEKLFDPWSDLIDVYQTGKR